MTEDILIIMAPTRIQNEKKYHLWMSEIENKIIHSSYTKIDIDFTECKFSHAVFTSFIGALVVIGKHHNKVVRIRYNNESDVGQYFQKSGLTEYFRTGGTNITNGYPYSISFSPIDTGSDSIINYIERIIKLLPVRLEPAGEETLFLNFYEICNNSAEHSYSKYGTYGCGHWMPSMKQLVFSLYDTGIGIPALVREKVNHSFNSLEALQWALRPGNSTKQLEGNAPRGLGLSNLLQFLDVSRNSLTIVSNDLYFHYKEGRYEYAELPSPIIGTFISISIKSDTEHWYTYEKRRTK